MKYTIIDNYKGEDMKVYKGYWKEAFKRSMQDLKLESTVHDARQDAWKLHIEDSLNCLEVAPYTSAEFVELINEEVRLNNNDFLQITENYNRITKKWQLRTSLRFVEDIIYNVSTTFASKHSSHSMILSIMHPVWNEHFSAAALNEIVREYDNDIVISEFPQNLHDMLLKLVDKTSFIRIHFDFNAIVVNPINNKEEYWLKSSVVDYATLFIDKSNIYYPKIQQDY